MTVFTRADLLHSLYCKRALPHGTPDDAAHVAETIRTHGLSEVIAGRHDSKPITHARGFELIYGQRLTLSRDGRR